MFVYFTTKREGQSRSLKINLKQNKPRNSTSSKSEGRKLVERRVTSLPEVPPDAPPVEL